MHIGWQVYCGFNDQQSCNCFFVFLCTSGLSQEEFRCVHNDNKKFELELYKLIRWSLV